MQKLDCRLACLQCVRGITFYVNHSKFHGLCNLHGSAAALGTKFICSHCKALVFYIVKSLKTESMQKADDDLHVSSGKTNPLIGMNPNLQKIDVKGISFSLKKPIKALEKQPGVGKTVQRPEDKPKIPKIENRQPINLKPTLDTAEEQDFMDILSDFLSSLCCINCENAESPPKVKKSETN